MHILKSKRVILSMAFALSLASVYRKRKQMQLILYKSSMSSTLDIDRTQNKLLKLLKILVPSAICKESFYLSLVAMMLIFRTFCDVWLIRNGTSIESAIISRDAKAFKKYLTKFGISMIPIAIVNNLLKLGINELALGFRSRLTKHFLHQYMTDNTFYKMSNIDKRITNPDQLLIQDVEKFASSLAELYSNLLKPVLDIGIYAQKLSSNVGGLWAPTSMISYLITSGLFLTWLRQPLGKYTSKEQKLEGALRHVTSRTIINAEEIAFYKGNKHEENLIKKAFNTLESCIRNTGNFKFAIGILDTMIIKYIGTMVGYYIVSRPLLSTQESSNMSLIELQEQYQSSGKMMIRLAQSVARLVMAGRELTKLSGFTNRLDEMQNVLNQLQSNESKAITYNACNTNDVIRLTNVPIVTPTNTVLVNNLNLEIKKGMNVLICGPNGCGKSSFFRIVGGLWPVSAGTLEKPDDIFYVPQKPYMPIGTLREQIIYPHSTLDMQTKGYTDKHLFELLKIVNLEYILDTQSWDKIDNWEDILSGGEKQKFAMARLFYHKPKFAILDECTSAMSVDIEGLIYEHCQTLDISILTVAHRKSLWKYHQYVLRFDGKGNVVFEPISEETQEFGS